jgi:hypothetical protein
MLPLLTICAKRCASSSTAMVMIGDFLCRGGLILHMHGQRSTAKGNTA